MTETTGEKYEQILAAAADVFAAKGYHQAKIAEIAAAAGVGKGTVYEYFPSKKDLFQQLLVHIFEGYFVCLQRAGEATPAPEVFIRRLLTESLRFFQERKQIARIVISDQPPVDAATQKRVMEVKREIYDFLETYLRAAADGGLIRPVSPRSVAVLITGLTIAVGHLIISGHEETDLETTVDGFVEVIMEGIRPG